MMKFIGKTLFFFHKAKRRLLMYAYRPLFKKHGKNFIFDPYSLFSFETIEVGNDVFIGPRANFGSIKSIKIGNKVMFGPDTSILGGDHNTSQIGEYMADVHWKLEENDLPVTIEDDVWIGAKAIILKGVTVGRGSIIAAGAIVVRDVPPYSIVAGIPAKVVKYRFEEKDLEQHKALLKLKNDKNS
jgi:acetyltransferase-like isoleucine patch superfamily enzyme